MTLLQKATENGIKSLSVKELPLLCDEIREIIIKTAKENGGHLSSNLGVVETTVAIYYVFNLPTDKLIFDVGHQCYTHKILSGRFDKFSTVRTEGGLSGFQNREESEFDPFTTGHAGSAISEGLGLCSARDKKGDNYCVINLVGDGSIINGINLEAITSSNVKPKNYIVILNDNEMSISKNGNGFYKIISKGTTKKTYVRAKKAVKKVFGESFFTRFLRKIRAFIKRTLNKNGYFFEKSGFKYVGVINGNNVKEMVNILERVKHSCKSKSVLLHVKTVKGKGYTPSEEHSDYYHGVGKDFNISNGIFAKTLGETLNEIIDKDNTVVAVTAAMKDGTGLSAVEEKHPNNFYDVGIAEEYAVSFAGGLAAGGLKPVVAIYSTFMQRAFDQIVEDVALQNLPVTFCLDRAGFVGADGKTHQGLLDLSYLLSVPNLTVFAPATASDLKAQLNYSLAIGKPCAIRYPNVKDDLKIEYSGEPTLWQKVNGGKGGKGGTILAVGPRMNKLALEIASEFPEICVYNARCVKPLDTSVLDSISGETVVTLEENSLCGGFGESVSAYFSADKKTKVFRFGAEDKFIPHGSVDSQIKSCGITKDNIMGIFNK